MCVMNMRIGKRDRRKAVNLSLTPDVIGQLEKLQAALRRPSKSNVIESLVHPRSAEYLRGAQKPNTRAALSTCAAPKNQILIS